MMGLPVEPPNKQRAHVDPDHGVGGSDSTCQSSGCKKSPVVLSARLHELHSQVFRRVRTDLFGGLVVSHG